MTVKDIMTLLESPDRVRVIKDGEEIYNQYANGTIGEIKNQNQRNIV